MTDTPSYPGMPRWVKVSGIIAGVLVLVVVVIMLIGIGGSHGPGRHMGSTDAGGNAPFSNSTTENALSGGGLGAKRAPPPKP